MPFEKGIVHTHKAGRPKGFKGVAREIMRRTNDGKKLVDFAMGVLQDEAQTMEWRMHALAWLSQFGLGKPMDATALADALKTDDERQSKSWLKALSTNQLEKLVDALEDIRGPQVSIAESATDADLDDVIDIGGEEEP